MINDWQASYTLDMADEIDSEEEIIADNLGVSIAMARKIIAYRDSHSRRQQAEVLAGIIGMLLRTKNMPVMMHSLALAYGMDDLNGAHSQAEVARQLGCTRALISHYVTGWRDYLATGGGGFDCLKFRKKNSTRATYAARATDKINQAKNKIYHERNSKRPNIQD